MKKMTRYVEMELGHFIALILLVALLSFFFGDVSEIGFKASLSSPIFGPFPSQPQLHWQEVGFERMTEPFYRTDVTSVRTYYINGTISYDYPNLTVAYCDGTPEECNEKHGIIRCPSDSENQFCTTFAKGEQYESGVCCVNSFKCVDWETICIGCQIHDENCNLLSCPPYCGHNLERDGCREAERCLRSSLSVSGSCEDAISIYGGVCDSGGSP